MAETRALAEDRMGKIGPKPEDCSSETGGSSNEIIGSYEVLGIYFIRKGREVKDSFAAPP